MILALKQELERLGYSDGTLRTYQARWSLLIKFANERQEVCFSERLGIDFLEKKLNIFEKEMAGQFKQIEVQDLRIIRMLGFPTSWINLTPVLQA
ncbi:hypothetical protein [Flavobacterium sp. ZS1P14]|uniref:hypothetical protein n=1 Tax=Flavobacterium sp. ZS1P14 TaxID=3401729 RepID=UPI003AAA9129